MKIVIGKISKRSRRIEMKQILVARSSMPSYEEYVEEIRDLWDTHWLTNMGVKHQQLEQQLKEYLNVKNISLMTNGHMALELTLQAMNLQGEVITTPYTFASTTHAIVRNGLEPVFCDINDIDYTIDVSKIEKLITDKTCAILPVHVYGNVCAVEEIGRIAKKYGLKVIYDAAHAFGETYNGKGIGTLGDASIFSFHATKVYNTIEGGAVCFEDSNLGMDLYHLKNFGIIGPEDVDAVGANAKIDEFRCAMGLCNLRHIDVNIQNRKKIVERYNSRLDNIPGIQVKKEQENVVSNYAYYPVIFDAEIFGKTRNEVFAILEQQNIHTRKYFYPLTNSFKCWNGKYDVEQTPVALHISKSVLALPLYADLSLETVDQICDLILK